MAFESFFCHLLSVVPLGRGDIPTKTDKGTGTLCSEAEERDRLGLEEEPTQYNVAEGEPLTFRLSQINPLSKDLIYLNLVFVLPLISYP